jgi:hypothetical protein
MSNQRRAAVSPAGNGRGRGGVRLSTATRTILVGRRAGPPAVGTAVAAVLEPLEPRQLFCAVHAAPLWLEPASLATTSTGTTTTTKTAAAKAAPGVASSFPPETNGQSGAVGAAAAPPLAGLPELHSYPAAPTAIYLDFNGNGANLPYDEDGDQTSFNAAEQANIAKAWQHMSAYFAPFNVNVTTVKPSVPTAWGLITNSLTGPGYSYVNVFPNNLTTNPQSFNPAGDARTRQSGIAHEIGHNFGLQHQSDYNLLGVKTNEYSSGYDLTHGPIMGVDYAQSIHKFFLGHPATSPTALQDDVAVIASKIAARPGGGDGFRPDDVGNAVAAASPLDVTNGVQTATGIIERMADADAFAFTAAAGGRMVVDVSPVNPSGLIPKVEVYDATGTLLAAKDDADQRNTNNNAVSVSVDLAPGTYYAVVRSHGDYGDIGQYDVTASELPGGWASQWVGAQSAAGSYVDHDPADRHVHGGRQRRQHLEHRRPAPVRLHHADRETGRSRPGAVAPEHGRRGEGRAGDPRVARPRGPAGRSRPPRRRAASSSSAGRRPAPASRPPACRPPRSRRSTCG